jgi:O-antigen/teichoic acid export membrane protein
VHAWLGPRAAAVAGCIPVIQILAVAVAFRVGNATGTTILKGAGGHRMLAWTNLGTGIVNVILSLILIRSYGLIGVAVGTLIPIAFAAIFIIQPAAYRRVGLSVRQGFVESVLPALWPAFVVGAVLAMTRHISSGTFLAVALQAGAGGALYLALFALAISRQDRAYYLATAWQLAGRRRRAPAAAAEVGEPAV